MQFNEVVAQNKKMMQVVEEACHMVLELAIPVEELVEARVQKLATGLHDARAEMVGVELELNLQIAELQFKAQPSTLSEVR